MVSVLSQSEKLELMAIQERFLQAGYQFVEHIFNDEKAKYFGNCSIKFAKDPDPHQFTYGNNLCGDFGWGRFDRMHAWRQAAEWLDNRRKLNNRK